jgi:hypothetical protein
MANDGSIVWKVDVDTREAKVDIKDITNTIEKETKHWDKAAKESSDNIGNSFSGMLKKLAAGFSAAAIGKALLDFGKQAIQAASDLQEVQNVVDVTFGDDANQVEKWAKKAGSQFGLTETQAKKFSSTLGAMLKSSGIAGQQIVDVSTNLAGLAADMASFYNLDFEEAFSKIRSGLSGMTMPLKELGIDMSVDTLNAFALAQGLEKSFNEMTQSEQTMLRYQYLMQATADAQGDFSRTSDGFANKVRILNTEFETFKATIGKEFIGIVGEALGFINQLVAALMPDESKRTVLDEFRDIDLDTENKIQKIRATAEEAKELTYQLEQIGGSKADQAGSKVQQIVNGLASVDLSQDKVGIVKDFISALAADIPTLAGLTGSSAKGAEEWLRTIADAANTLDENDAEGWTKLLSEIKQGLPGLENTDFGAKFFEALGSGFTEVEGKSSVLSWAVDMLGDKTNKTAEEQRLWLETCRRLVQTIPGLSAIINTETGEVKGGTQAIKDYVQAWEDGQTKLAYLGAIEKKQTALEQKFGDLPGLELEALVAEKRARDAKKALDAINEAAKKATGSEIWAYQQEYEAQKKIYDDLAEKAKTAREAYENQKAAYDEAVIALKEQRDLVNAMPGETKAAMDASEQWWVDNAENIRIVVNETQNALTALDDYVEGVREAVSKNVDSIVKGFNQIERAGDDARKKSAEVTEEYNKALNKYSKSIGKEYFNADGTVNLQKMSDNYDNLSKAEKEAYNELAKLHNKQLEYNKEVAQYTTTGMQENLQGQIEYMKTYLENLEKLRSYGVSNELLAFLSDGSTESAEYLAALVGDESDAAKQAAREIDQTFKQVQSKKEQFTNELTDQQLTIDQTYQSLAEKAKEAVNALNLATEAQEATGATVEGVAQGIADHVDDVKEQVDKIIEQLNRLNGYGINIDFGGFGSITFRTSTGKDADASGRFGLDYVPRDDYLIRAHEGERLLTAQENQIWNSLLRGGYAGFSLDDLGGVMRDNVKAGGNVYLDGKVVGSVISTQQGKTYRQLQRSGWQS